jgi:hypothetical protein
MSYGMQVDEFIEAVEVGLQTGDWSGVDAFVTDNSSFTYDFEVPPDLEPFDEAMFAELLMLLSSERFRGAEGTSSVLILLEYDWGILTPSQRTQLMPAMVDAYPHLADCLSVFIVAELLGAYYCDARSLSALIGLKNVQSESHRALVVMGLRAIVKNTDDPDLALRARAELLSMREDPSVEVRQELEGYG